MGRNSQGVRGIRLRDNDQVVAMVVIRREGTLLSISENGFGKRTEISGYKVTKRGSKGVITLKTTERNGKLISLLEVVDNDDLMIVTKEGMIIRQSVNKISIIGRNTQGVKLIALNGKDKVYDIARIVAEDEQEEGEENAESPDQTTDNKLTTDSKVAEKNEQPLDEEVTNETADVVEDAPAKVIEKEKDISEDVSEEVLEEEIADKHTTENDNDQEQEIDFGLDS